MYSDRENTEWLNCPNCYTGMNLQDVRCDKHRYTCTCDNDGPRWTRDGQCCPGCFQWALDHHQEMKVNGVQPVTIEMVEAGCSHGIDTAKLREILGK